MLLLLVGLSCLSVASCQLLNLQEGEACTPLQGGNGTCKALQNCSTILDFNDELPPICTFKGNVPIVCCPNNVVSSINGVTANARVADGMKAGQYCRMLQEICKFYRMLVDGVIGGVESKPKEQPFMVAIGYGNQDDIGWRCGGSLISPRFVLSAAHCSKIEPYGPALWAKMGFVDFSSSYDAKPVTKIIVQRIAYPDYVESQNYHDIILFKLDSDVVFNRWVLPICLQTKREIPARTTTVMGWGLTGSGNGPSEKLLEANVDIYNETECSRVFPTNPGTPKGYRPDIMFCAGVPDGSKDTCAGDSGGPAVIRKPGKCVKTQIGITSYGNGCARPDSPGVYTRVSFYVPWIEKIVFDKGVF